MLLRPFSILLPRLTQVIGWTFDPSNLQKPLLSPEEARQIKKDITEKFVKITTQYIPPAYKPPKVSC